MYYLLEMRPATALSRTSMVMPRRPMPVGSLQCDRSYPRIGPTTAALADSTTKAPSWWYTKPTATPQEPQKARNTLQSPGWWVSSAPLSSSTPAQMRQSFGLCGRLLVTTMLPSGIHRANHLMNRHKDQARGYDALRLLPCLGDRLNSSCPLGQVNIDPITGPATPLSLAVRNGWLSTSSKISVS